MNIFEERYKRQRIMPYFNDQKQNAIHNSCIGVVGCGGLGSLNILYLASLGIGNLILIDDDKVSLSNLNRQIIHDESNIGQFKVDSAYHRVKELNSTINMKVYRERLTYNNCREVLKECDIIVDAVDNINTRKLLDDYTYKYNIPIVFAAVEGFHGFIYPKPSNQFPRYSSIFKYTENEKKEICVYGDGVGIVSSIQCNEVIKLIGNTNNITNIICIDMLSDSFGITRLEV